MFPYITKEVIGVIVTSFCMFLSFKVYKSQKVTLNLEKDKFGISDITSIEQLERFRKLKIVLSYEVLNNIS